MEESIQSETLQSNTTEITTFNTSNTTTVQDLNQVISQDDDDESKSSNKSSNKIINPVKLPDHIIIQDLGILTNEGSTGHLNEDRYLVQSTDNFHVFATFDGHGGAFAAEYIRNELFQALNQLFHANEYYSFRENDIIQLIQNIDHQFCQVAKTKQDFSGTCAIFVIIWYDPIIQSIQTLTANIGDCRVLLGEKKDMIYQSEPVKPKSGISFKWKDRLRSKSSIKYKDIEKYINLKPLSQDHSYNNWNERQRVLKAGGYIQHKRIAGVLEPFRTIGDIDMKIDKMKGWIISTPEVRLYSLQTKYSILILATDGIWSVLSNEEVFTIVYQHVQFNQTKKTCQRAAQAILKQARSHGSRDDITIIIVAIEIKGVQ